MTSTELTKPPTVPNPMADQNSARGQQDPGGGESSSVTRGSIPPPGFAPTSGGEFTLTPPAVTLPKGGGAIRGIDEKLEVNACSGTCTLNIPIPLSKARSDAATPSLSLSYNSGGGNGPFGHGWGISLQAITRKTDRGIPRYLDGGSTEDEDVFLYAGIEDLVPRLLQQTPHSLAWTMDESEQDGYMVRRYLPRIEGSFFRIERCSKINTLHDVFWRVRTGDNEERIFGRDINSRISDGEGRIYSWLLSQSFDRYGNAIEYTYKAEDSAGVNLAVQSCESNRTEAVRMRNRYLKSIKYGNITPHHREGISVNGAATTAIVGPWMFEVVFDYGEGHALDHSGAEMGPWACRKDAFSTYRAGFEIRTYRLCRRILMFHHFPHELGETDEGYLVGSTTFEYKESGAVSLLTKLSRFGHYRSDDGLYSNVAIPPLSLSYTEPAELEQLSVRDSDTPFEIGANQYQWIDLDSEGLPGVLSEQAGSWFYRRNLSANNIVNNTAEPRFGPLEIINPMPAASLNSPGTRFADLGGTGEVDLVVVDPAEGVRGFFERTTLDGWTNFRPFNLWPNIDFGNVQFVDLTGDGQADIMVTEDEAFSWFRAMGKEGYAMACRTPQSRDEEKGPKLVFADGLQTIYLSDVSGDGLHDLLRIRNGDICYWPSLGYGQFGEKVTMDSAPWFDHVDQFTHDRLRLTDVDGTGTADLIYFPPEGGADIYLNLAGNAWSQKHRLEAFPKIDTISAVSTVDLLGNGGTCLVWTRPLSAPGLRYVDLTDGKKPFLLEGYTNGLGLEAKVSYVPSTCFYLDAKQAGDPWATRLPFPVQCVSKTELFDHVSKSYSSVQYKYHDGYYDRTEREFRGFGMAEQWDTAWDSNSVSFPSASNMKKEYLVTPTRQKIWFHTGAYSFPHNDFTSHPIGSQLIWTAPLLGDSTFPDDLGFADTVEAASRSLKGSILREEFYVANDLCPRFDLTGDGGSSSLPFRVSSKNYTIQVVQPGTGTHHAVFLVVDRESMILSAEENLHDPRVSHSINLEHDKYGNSLKSVSITYGRQDSTPSEAVIQAETQIVYSERWYTNSIDSEAYIIPRMYKTRDYQLTGILPAASLGRFTFTQFAADDFGLLKVVAIEIPFEEVAVLPSIQKRLISGSDSRYRRNDLNGVLEEGRIESLILPDMSYQLALTPDLVKKAYAAKGIAFIDGAMHHLIENGGYVLVNGHFCIPSGCQGFSTTADPKAELTIAHEHFFTFTHFTDQFHATTTVQYDNYDLLPVKITNALGDTTSCDNNYQHLQPSCITDVNRNRQLVVQDAVGEIVGTAVQGRVGDTPLGDSLQNFPLILSDQQKTAFLQSPRSHAAALLGTASSRTITIYNTSAQPTVPSIRATIAREIHSSDATLQNDQSRVLVTFVYFDGLSRQIQAKTQADDGWLGTGWTVWNNKGLVVKQYEPFFDRTHHFVNEAQHGTSAATVFYDYLGRPVCSFSPDLTWTKVIYDTWKTTAYDASDVLMFDPRTDIHVGKFYRGWKGEDSSTHTWYSARLGRDSKAAALENSAALRTLAHHNTPTVTHLDSFRRPIVTVEHNGGIEFYITQQVYDITDNVLSVTDAKDRKIVRTDYDMCRQVLHHWSMDFGEEWFVNDVAGQPLVRCQDDKIRIRTEYDLLRRPIARYQMAEEPHSNLEIMFERFVFGEQRSEVSGIPAEMGNVVLHNARGRLYKQYDQSGVVTTHYDFKGNIVATERQLLDNYKSITDWSGTIPTLEVGTFIKTGSFDALNRLTEVGMGGSLTRYSYNSLSLISSVKTKVFPPPAVNDAHTIPPSIWTTVVNSTKYDAIGRTTSTSYGNNTRREYTFDILTQLLLSVRTRTIGTNLVRQDLQYTYDPRGNITHIEDKAQSDSYQGTRVSASRDYVYDAVNRLIESAGRKDLRRGGVKRENGNKLGRYRESYSYDSTGNILAIKQFTSNDKYAGTTKRYYYENAIHGQEGRYNNRVSRTKIGRTTERFFYDLHGNVTGMAKFPILEWNFQNQLHKTCRQFRTKKTPNTTHYVYGSDGNRVRKVTERQAGSGAVPTRVYETIYIGELEIFRKYHADGKTNILERKTTSVGYQSPINRVEVQRRAGSTVIRQAPYYKYQLQDHLGSVGLELDNAGNVLSYEEYSAFGQTTYQAPTNSLTAPKTERFSGKVMDPETGLYYFGARYYASSLARWISPDPIGIGDGPNVYCYAFCNPVTFIDPDGRANRKASMSRKTRNKTAGATGGSGAPNQPAPKQQEPRKVNLVDSGDDRRTPTNIKEANGKAIQMVEKYLKQIQKVNKLSGHVLLELVTWVKNGVEIPEDGGTSFSFAPNRLHSRWRTRFTEFRIKGRLGDQNLDVSINIDTPENTKEGKKVLSDEGRRTSTLLDLTQNPRVNSHVGWSIKFGGANYFGHEFFHVVPGLVGRPAKRDMDWTKEPYGGMMISYGKHPPVDLHR